MSALNELTPEQKKAHKIKWFVWAGGQRMPREATMRGQWGYDVECSCGWETRTGGAVKRYVDDLVWGHKWDVKNGFDS